MKALELLVLLFISSVPFSSASSIYPDYTKLCRLFSKNIKLRLPGSCNQYIECNGETGNIISCPENTKFNKETEKCVQNLDTTKLCENRCIGEKDGRFVAKPTFCRSYYSCKDEVAYEGICAPLYYFDQHYQECVYPSNSSCIMNMVNNICELVKEGTKFREESDCSRYYECKNNTQVKKVCKHLNNILYFNVENGECEKRENVACSAHTIPENICLNKTVPVRGLVSDHFSCRGYFICADKGDYAHDLKPHWAQCPKGKYFNPSTKSCGDPWNIKCPYDRCDGYGDSLATSERNNCRNYFVCKNDRKVEEIACKEDYFFDERQQKCVRDIIYYESCDQKDTHL